MLRPSGKAYKIAKQVLANKGVKVAKPKSNQKTKQTGPYLYHQDCMKEKKYSKKAESKIKRVMHEFGEKKLHSGSKSGPVVKSRAQALAIGINEAKRKGLKVGEKG